MGFQIQIGIDPISGRKLFIPIEEIIQKHWHVLGQPGAGKTTYLSGIATQIIRGEFPVFILDFKEDIYNNILRYCTYNSLKKRTVVIDPIDAERSPRVAPGLNGLDDIGTPSAVAGRMRIAFKMLFGQQLEMNPWLDDITALALNVLAHSRQATGDPWSIFEASNVVSLDSSKYRKILLDSCKDRAPFLYQRFQELEKHQFSHLAQMFNPLNNRIAQLRYSESLTAILGQNRTTIDFDAVLAKKGIFLLRAFHPDLPSSDLDFLAAVCLEKIKAAFYRRPARDRKIPAFIIIDEVQRLCSGGAGFELADFLERVRSYGANVILSHQHLSQLLPAENPNDKRLQDAVVNLTRVRCYFKTGSRDAEEGGLWRDVFGDQIAEATQERKHTVVTETHRPIKTYEEVVSESHSEAVAEGKSESSGSGSSMTQSIGASSMETPGSTTNLYGPDGVFLGRTEVDSRILAGDSAQGGKASSDFYSDSSSRSRSVTRAWSRTRTPFYDYEKFFQEGAVTFVTLEEARERFIQYLSSQDDRNFLFKLHNLRAIPLVSPKFQAYDVSQKTITYFKEAIYAGYTRSVEAILKDVSNRVPVFLEAYKKASENGEHPTTKSESSAVPHPPEPEPHWDHSTISVEKNHTMTRKPKKREVVPCAQPQACKSRAEGCSKREGVDHPKHE